MLIKVAVRPGRSSQRVVISKDGAELAEFDPRICLCIERCTRLLRKVRLFDERNGVQ